MGSDGLRIRATGYGSALVKHIQSQLQPYDTIVVQEKSCNTLAAVCLLVPLGFTSTVAGKIGEQGTPRPRPATPTRDLDPRPLPATRDHPTAPRYQGIH